LPDDGTATRLIEKRYLTLVIRLLVDGRDKVQQGVLVDVHEKSVGKFRQLEELPDLITRWLETRGNQQD
jgi:hypothetical protein